MKVHGTRVGSDGTGYYRGSDGKYYYGNPQNGYLTETIESQKKSTSVAASSIDGNKGESLVSGLVQSGISDGGLIISSVVGAAAFTVFWATLILAFLIIAIIYSVIVSWPEFIGILVESYRVGAIDFAVILVTGAIVFLAACFAANIYIVIAKKRMKSKSFLIICTMVIMVLLSIVHLMTGELTLGIIMLNAIYGVSLASLPAFLLCFIEHLATKKIRGDNQWFITRISKLISNIFIGHSVGMVVFGILAMIAGSIFYLTYEEFGIVDMVDGGIRYLPQAIMAVGVSSMLMGILARKK